MDDDMANLIVAQLLYLDAADPNKDVTLYVNSPGGSVTAGAMHCTHLPADCEKGAAACCCLLDPHGTCCTQRLLRSQHSLRVCTPHPAGMAVFDTMRHIRPNVSTVCVGLAASMGAFLLASGHQGKRYSLPNSRIMIHQPLGGAQGQAADIEIQVC